MPRRAEGDPAGSAPRAVAPARLGTHCAVLAGLAIAGWLWTLHVAASGTATGLFHDGGVYVVTARALADGAGYRVVSAPDSPPAVRYPPLLPLALAAVTRVAPRFPDDLPLLKGVGLLALLGTVVLLPAVLGAAGASADVAAATALLTAAAPVTMRYATAVASELPFTMLALAALGLVARGTRGSASGWWAAAAGAVAGLAFLTRVVGIAVIGAGVVALVRVDRRRAAAFALAAAPALVGWGVWLLVHPHTGAGPGYAAALAHDGLPRAGDAAAHLVALPAAAGLVALPGLADVLSGDAPWPLLAAAYVLGVIALGGALRGPYGPYVALSLAAATAVPWFQPRFLVPLAPLLLGGMLTTLAAGPRRHVRVAALTAALLVLALAGDRASLARVRAAGVPALEQGSHPEGRWPDVVDAVVWLRTHTAPDDVLASFDDPLLYLYTGRRTVQAYPSLWHPSPDDVTRQIVGARYIVDIAPPETGTWSASRAAWRAWLSANAATLARVYVGPGITIWRRDA